MMNKNKLTDVPTLVFGDRNLTMVAKAKKMGLGSEWIEGDPMNASDLDAIVSPANTIGEMAGGYDLVIRTRLGAEVERRVKESIKSEKMFLGMARVLETGASIPKIIVVPTVMATTCAVPSKTPGTDVIEIGTYNLMMEAYRNNIKRVGTVLLGGGIGALSPDAALAAMELGYFRAYEEIDELIYG